MSQENPRDAYSSILDAIDRGIYTPGAALVESDLAKKFSMSRTPIREALQRLETQGVLHREGRSEVTLLRKMVDRDNALIGKPYEMSRANRRFHGQIHRASHNRYLIQQLDAVHRAMALLVQTTLAEEGRAKEAQAEHEAIVLAIEARDGDAACDAIRAHISHAYQTRLALDLEAPKDVT